MKGGCGFPMGPFALLDLVGLDTSLAILDALYEEFRDPNYAAVPAAAPDGRRRAAGPEVGPGLPRLPEAAEPVAVHRGPRGQAGRMAVTADAPGR